MHTEVRPSPADQVQGRLHRCAGPFLSPQARRGAVLSSLAPLGGERVGVRGLRTVLPLPGRG
jgi:hypothetical protein